MGPDDSLTSDRTRGLLATCREAVARSLAIAESNRLLAFELDDH